MNCRQFQKYAGAFADGELDLESNLEALEHLNMCRDCTLRVDEVSALCSALDGLWADHRAPAHLKPHIQRGLDEVALETDANDADPFAGTGGYVPQKTRWLLPLSLAAMVLLSLFAWQHWTPVESGTLTLVAARTGKEVTNTHMECINDRWHDHHDATLSRNLPVMSQQLSERLGITAIAPDYSASGFLFVGADVCAIAGRPAAHAIYHDPSRGAALSVFSSARIAEFRPDSVSVLGDSDVFVRRIGEFTVAAVTESEQTYTFCSDLSEARLLGMVRQVRSAGLPLHTDRLTSLAFTGGNLTR